MIETSGQGRHFDDDSLKRFFIMALMAHVAFVVVASILSFVFDLGIFTSKNNEVPDFVQSAVRVDVVAMPKLTVQELKNMAPQMPAADKADTSPDESSAQSKSDVEFKTDKKVELSSLLSNLSKRNVEKSKKKKKKGPSLSAKELNSLVMEGNKVSAGQSLVGDSLAEAQGEYAEYVAAIPSFVRPYWKLPSYLIEKDLRARIKIYISENGKIVKSEVYESSGVAEFDNRALSALKETGILPVPEKSIRSMLASGKVVLGFPL